MIHITSPRKSGAPQYCGSYLDDIGFPSSLATWNADSIRSMELLGILYLLIFHCRLGMGTAE